MSPGDIISLGSINVDFQVRVASQPGPGETLLGSQFAMLGGGKGANVAYLARRLGAQVRLIGRVGDDHLREHALRSLQEIGVDLQWVTTAVGVPTGVALIAVPPDGDKTIVLAANANGAWMPAAAESAAAAVAAAPPGSVLVTNLEVPEFVVQRAMAEARRAGHQIILDPSPADRASTELCAAADYLTPNASEAERLTGVTVRSPKQGFRAGQALTERTGSTALVKLPAGGCAVVRQQACEHIPVIPVDVVDKTGAGDAFAGALAVALLEQHPLSEAARFAVAAASLAVTGYGSQPAYPSRSDLERLLAGL